MSARSPRTSVCLAAYNSAATIDGVLASILAQDDEDFELIVVDDASTDDTVAHVGACRDRRVRLVRQPANGGQARALNRAMGEARGEFIKLADSDDPFEPGCVRLLREAAEADPRVALVFCRRHVELEGESHAGTDWWLREHADLHLAFSRLEPLNDGAALLDEYTRGGFAGNWFCEPAGLLARRRALEEVGGISLRIRQVPDLDLCLRLLTAGAAGFVDEPLYTYKLARPGSISLTVDAVEAQWLDYLWCLAALRQLPGVWAAHPGLAGAERSHRRGAAHDLLRFMRAGNEPFAKLAGLASYSRARAAVAAGRSVRIAAPIGPAPSG